MNYADNDDVKIMMITTMIVKC